MEGSLRKEASPSDFMDLKDVIVILWRRKWLLLLITFLGAASVFVISQLSTPVYQASTTLLIDQAPDPQSSDYSALLASERLALTYAQMLTIRPVLEEARSRLELQMELEDLEKVVDVDLVKDTQLIKLRVESADKYLATNIANTIVEVFIEQIDVLQAGRFASSKASLRAQLDALTDQIRANEVAIASLGTPQTESLGAGLELLRVELAQYQASYTSLLQSYEDLRVVEARTISNVIQVEPAEPPANPVRPRIYLNTLIAGVIGGMVAIGAIFMLEHLDDRIRSAEDVARVTHLPVIGYVPDSKKLSASGTRERLMISEPRSPLAESYRLLRTNIELAGTQGTPRSILVGSPEPGDGKTTVATQLAVSMAEGGKRVILLDANLRRPRLDEYFGIKNELGLSDMLVDDLVPQVVAHQLVHWRLKVITSGKPVDNPVELMGSIRMLKLLTRLREQADVAIFDGPPFLVAESFILASKLESVLLVMQSDRTRERFVWPVVEQLERARANIIGVVLNRVPKREAYGYDLRFGDLVKGQVSPNSGAILQRQSKKPFPLTKEKETSSKG